MTDGQHFSGEDNNAGFASPIQDLVAAAVLAVLSLWIMIESVRLANPGTLATAPGLLPFLTAASLCAMAASLAAMAIRRQRKGLAAIPVDEEPDHPRTVLLVCLIGAYLVSLQLISFEYVWTVSGMRLGYGAFEVLSILTLTTILVIFWCRPLWMCLTVSTIWVTALAAVFRYVFIIPLPGAA